MNTHKITKEHIAYLHKFCKKKDVIYVDLRIELVDHLCELIQSEWEKNPQLSFRDAFHKVYKSFGIFGFMDIAAQHEKAVQKRYWKEIWLFFKKWITPPRILLTLTIALLVFFLLDNFVELRAPFMIGTGLIYVSSMGYNLFQFMRNKRILNEQNILMGGSRQGFGWLFYFLYLFILQPLTLHGNLDIIETPWLVTALFMLCILFARANYLLMERARTQLEDLKLKLV